MNSLSDLHAATGRMVAVAERISASTAIVFRGNVTAEEHSEMVAAAKEHASAKRAFNKALKTLQPAKKSTSRRR